MMRWTFDANVAAAFDHIAKTQIPNYETVIDRCVDMARHCFGARPDAKIIDVGSARGNTLRRLHAAGFANIYGVESSPHMKEVSAHAERVILSDRFPVSHGPFDMVLANWTLHFIAEREAYLRDIYRAMAPGGVLILSDRMLGSPESYQLYLDFKRRMGVSDADIKAKEEALEGVLIPRPLSWYFDVLGRVGFAAIEVIDAAWCFNTLCCRKN